MYEDLVRRLREHAEWAEGNEWETPLRLENDLSEAADVITKLSSELEQIKDIHSAMENDLINERMNFEYTESRLSEAVEDLKIAQDCRTCGNVNAYCRDNPDACGGWQWRGAKEVNEK